MYNTNQQKITAFRFKDPFAADKFVVCHATKGKCCRPNCDMGILNYKDQDLRFYNSVDTAMAQGFVPCEFCFPDLQNKPVNYRDGSHVNVNLDLLLNTVTAVNKEIGFEPLPSMKKYPESKSETSHLKERKSSSGPSPHSSISLSKNELDRLQLITIACRHIALAASSTVLEVSCPEGERKNSILMTTGKKRRRRGGVLGFKELAAKSRLSPWHFHRVFKNVTGLTPKNYGDRCYSYIRKHSKGVPGRRIIVINTRIANPTLANEEEHQLQYESIHSAGEKGRQVRRHSMSVVPNRMNGTMNHIDVKGIGSRSMQISRSSHNLPRTPNDGMTSSLAMAAEKRKSFSSVGAPYKKARSSVASSRNSQMSEIEPMTTSSITSNDMVSRESDMSNLSTLSENNITSFANPFRAYVSQPSNSSPTSLDFISSDLTEMSPRSLGTDHHESRTSQNNESLSIGSNMSMSASPTYEYTSGETNDVFAGLSIARNDDQSALNADAPYFYFISPESESASDAMVTPADSANNNINFAELMAVAPGTDTLTDTSTGFNFGAYNEPQITASQIDLSLLPSDPVQKKQNMQNDHKIQDPVMSGLHFSSFYRDSQFS